MERIPYTASTPPPPHILTGYLKNKIPDKLKIPLPSRTTAFIEYEDTIYPNIDTKKAY